MSPENTSATIASVTVQIDVAKPPDTFAVNEMFYQVRWLIEDKNGRTGEIFVISSFSIDPAKWDEPDPERVREGSHDLRCMSLTRFTFPTNSTVSEWPFPPPFKTVNAHRHKIASCRARTVSENFAPRYISDAAVWTAGILLQSSKP